MWRAEDQSLLEALENELVLDAFAQAEAQGAPVALPRGAAGLVAELRAVPGGADAVEAAVAALLAGARQVDLSELRARTRPGSLAGLPPALLHQLALFHARVAGALAACAPDAAVVLHGRALGAWLALFAEGRYLEALADEVLGQAASAADRRGALEDALFDPLRALGRQACAAAPTLDRAGHTALAALGEVGTACRLAGVGGALADRVAASAERQRAEAVQAALEPVAAALGEAVARGRADEEGPRVGARLAEVWLWSHRDEHVERFAVGELTSLAWVAYGKDGLEPIRRLLTPVEPLVESLALRIRGDESRIAYAARAATMLVFRSEMAQTTLERRRLAELAVEICPSHKNGRLILANALCRELEQALGNGAPPAARRDALVATLERATTLCPGARGVPELRRRFGLPPAKASHGD